MAKTPENAIKLMTDMVPASVGKAKSEAAGMQTLAAKDQKDFKLAPWDWQFYSEKVKQTQYKLDESQIKQYFLLDRVLQDGVFFAANKLYGITFKERHDLPVYHPDVRVFEVFDADGKSMALWYGDYFKRDNKSGGAWEDNFVRQSTLLGTHTVAFNVCNFSKPGAGEPALISYDDVVTMFHEFGHALHDLFSNTKYPTLSGTGTTRDFVEFLAVQRALGRRAERVRQLRQALQDRRADAGRTAAEDQGRRHIRPGLRDDGRIPRRRCSTRPGIRKSSTRRSGTSTSSKTRRSSIPRRLRAGAAALSHELFRPHLGRRLFGRLRLPVERGAARRRLLLVQGTRRHDPRKRPALPATWCSRAAAPRTWTRCTARSAARSRASKRCSKRAA
jgi:hypothetical protein